VITGLCLLRVIAGVFDAVFILLHELEPFLRDVLLSLLGILLRTLGAAAAPRQYQRRQHRDGQKPI
jgi:hypothetical protein